MNTIYPNKSAAIYGFWSSFELPVYDEGSVPDEAELPYITYQFTSGSLGSNISLTAGLWYKDTSWVDIDKKVEQVAEFITFMNAIKIQGGGRIVIYKPDNFATRIYDEDENIKHYSLQIEVEYLTPF